MSDVTDTASTATDRGLRPDRQGVGFTGPAVVVALAGVAAVSLALLPGAEPVGQPPLDDVVIAVPVALLTWLGAVVPRRWTAWLALPVGALSLSPAVVAAAAVIHVLARFGRPSAAWSSAANSVTVGSVLVMCSYSRLGGPPGTSAGIAIAVGTTILVLALIRLRRSGRVAIGVLVALLLAVLGASSIHLALAAGSTADELRAGRRYAEEGLRDLADGDVDGARDALAAAAESFEEAHDALDSPWNLPAALVPVVAQHRGFGLDVSTIGRDGVEDISAELDGFDFASLRFVEGRFDLEALDDLAGRLDRIVGHVDRLQLDVVAQRNEWLVDRVDRQLNDFELDLERERKRADLALAVVDVLPDLLGRDGARTYFLAFTTQSEARGLSGLMGNWVEVTVDRGRVTVSGFGRSDDLDDAAPPGVRTVSGPEEWLERYGEFGFVSGPGGKVGTDPWKNITMSPQISSTGQVIAELYPQSGGSRLDGVFFLDIDTLSLLLRFTGAVELEALDRSVGPQNARQFLLRRQYDILDKTDRIDLLEDVSSVVVEQLLAGSLPPALELIDVLGPQVEQRRLGGWMVRPDEHAILERTGLSTDLPDPTGRDALAISLNNFAGNKIDYYLRGAVTYDVQVDPGSELVRGTVRVSLSNTAPAEGDPPYVIGNLIRAPDGTSRTWLTVYSVLAPTEVVLDGVPVGATFGDEAGYITTSVVIEQAAGAESVLEVHLGGAMPVSDSYELALTLPPTVAPMPLDVSVAGPTATNAASFEFAGTEVVTFAVR